eukprot:PLAT6441.10.p1 GENE.PLAT6441.10~~PLAT6441.10.p1  ORF type:complete len:2012 (+),score=1094.48 PLAT6441.10:39-6038(+)
MSVKGAVGVLSHVLVAAFRDLYEPPADEAAGEAVPAEEKAADGVEAGSGVAGDGSAAVGEDGAPLGDADDGKADDDADAGDESGRVPSPPPSPPPKSRRGRKGKADKADKGKKAATKRPGKKSQSKKAAAAAAAAAEAAAAEEGEGEDGEDARAAADGAAAAVHDDKADSRPAEESPIIAARLAEVAVVESQLEEALRLADGLEAYLEQQRAEAAAADAAERLRLQEAGLLVKAQIPVGASPLTLDVAKLSTAFGQFGGSLIIARALVEDYSSKLARRMGQTLAETSFMAASSMGVPRKQPHYLAKTAASKSYAASRSTAALARRSAALAASSAALDADLDDYEAERAMVTSLSREEDEHAGLLSETLDSSPSDPAAALTAGKTRKREARKHAKEARRRKKKPAWLTGMPAEERALNERMLVKMQHRLNFLRNPRFAKTAAASSTAAAATAGGDASAAGDAGAAADKRLFIVEPNPVVISEYAVGGSYTVQLKLRNVSSVLRRLRVLPPATPYFSAGQLKLAASAGGFVAPGMAARLSITFKPDSLADFADELTVVTEAGQWPVPLLGRREPPSLTLPPVLQSPPCLVGGTLRTVYTCTNVGGAGSFRLLPAEHWPEPPATLEEGDTLSLPPFTVSPTQFALPPNSSVPLTVVYRPQDVAQHSRKFVMVCDNCEVHHFTVTARSCDVQLRVSAVDGTPMPDGAPRTLSRLFYPDTTPGSCSTKTFTLTNDTPVAVPFTWQLPAGSPFSLTPAAATIEPDSSVDCRLAFAPRQLRSWRQQAQLLVCRVPPPSIPEDVMQATGGALPPDLTALADMLYMRTDLAAKAAPVRVSLQPQLLPLPPGLLRGVTYTHTVLLRNCSDAAASVSLSYRGGGGGGAAAGAGVDDGSSEHVGLLSSTVEDVVDMKGEEEEEEEDVEAAGGKAEATEAEEQLPPLLVMQPDAVLLAAGETREVKLLLTASKPGPLALDVCADVKLGLPAWLRLTADIAGPQLQLLSPEIDMGLLSVGHSVTKQLRFRNLSAVAARWRMAELLEAADAKRAGDVCHVRCEPAEGVTPPHGDSCVQLVCTGGRLPQRLRGVLQCEVAHGQTRFIRVKGEIQAPKVYLSPTAVDMGVTYATMRFSRKLTLTNISNLPADFRFELPTDERFSVSFSPARGTLPPRGRQDVRFEFHPAAAGEIDTVFRLHVVGMLVPLGFSLRTSVRGLVVSFLPLAAGETAPPMVVPRDDSPEAAAAAAAAADGGVDASSAAAADLPAMQFGEQCPIYTRRSLRLVIRNHSAIPSRYSLAIDRFPPAERPDRTGSAEDAMAALAGSSASHMAARAGRRGRGGGAVSGSSSALDRRFGAAATTSAGGGSAVVGGAGAGGVMTRRASRAAAAARQESRRASAARASRVPAGSLTSFPSHAASLLDERAQQAAKFRSRAGREHVAVKDWQGEARGVLAAQRGAAFLATPEQGVLPPWDSVEIELCAYSDMPGRYEDALLVDIEGLPRCSLPIRMHVVGTPLSISADCVGMELHAKPPTLRFPQQPFSAPPVAQSFVVKNSGPFDAQLSWRMRNTMDKFNMLSVSLQTTGKAGRPLAVRVAAHEQVTTRSPFSISPRMQTVPAHGSATFTVQLRTPADVKALHSLLIADALYQYPRDRPAPTASPAMRACLKLALRGETAVPQLQVDKRLPGGARRTLKWRCFSTQARGDPAQLVRTVLSNTTPAPLTFTLSTHYPFAIARTVSSAPPHPLDAPAGAVALPGEKKKPQVTHSLPPGTNVEVTLQFLPPRLRVPAAAASAAAAAALRAEGGSKMASPTGDASSTSAAAALASADDPSNAAMQLQREFHGLLGITFSNGHLQEVALRADYLRPFVMVSPSSYNFGAVHVEKAGRLTLYVCNPTPVNARWTLRHVAAPPRRRLGAVVEDEGDDAVPADEPDRFSFSATRGVVQGPTLPLTFAGAHPPDGLPPGTKQLLVLTMVFKPARDCAYRSRFRFYVDKGPSFDLLFEGRGTYLEEEE